jgi:hypothetical protein
MGLLCIAFVYICVQLFKALGVYHIIMDHSIAGVPQGVFEGQFICLWECAIFIMNIGIHI